jgi:hypothetical protein
LKVEREQLEKHGLSHTEMRIWRNLGSHCGR